MLVQVKEADVVVLMGDEHTTLPNTCFKPGVTLINCGPALLPGVSSSHHFSCSSHVPRSFLSHSLFSVSSFSFVCSVSSHLFLRLLLSSCGVCDLCFLFFVFVWNMMDVLCSISQRSLHTRRSLRLNPGQMLES